MNRDEHESDKKEQVRLASLADPGSGFYQGISRVLLEADERERAARKRSECVRLPFTVSLETKRAMEDRFGWTIDMSDCGVRSRFPEFVAALVYCMSLRNLMKGGSDGEEVVAVDEDLAMMTARGASYVHVCRTHASVRLRAGYAHEDEQLQRLMQSSKAGTALAAADVHAQLVAGGGSRVCVCAAKCSRAADVVLFNHARTPVSLKQAVATARAHGADVVEGECFFQPSMLTQDEGELEAFPGRYVVDRDRDELSYIPASDPSMSFSHPYSALMSFFLNHEYHDRSGRWLVEKGLSKQGVYAYVIRRADAEVFRTLEVVTARYYPAHLSRVTRIEYPAYDTKAAVRGGTPFVRKSVNVFTVLYDAVVERMLAADVKDVTPSNVMTALRDRNNTAVVYGDVVRRPERIPYDDEVAASIAICASVRWRKAAASSELNVLLDAVKARFALREASALKLLQLAVVTMVSDWWLWGGGPKLIDASVDEIERWMSDSSVTVENVDNVVAVTRTIGISQYTVGEGNMQPWLPGYRATGTAAVLQRARDFVRKLSASGSDAHVEFSVPEGSLESFQKFPPSSMSHSSGSEERHSKVLEVSAGERAVENIEHRMESPEASPVLSEFQRKVVDKLIKDQDALRIAREPRHVTRYEGPDREDVVPVPTLKVPVVPAIQEDYDKVMPGLSQHDAEVVPYLASESDCYRNIDVHMAVNDSKRDIASPRIVRRSRVRTAGSGARPRDQAGLISALFKRNAGVPPTRGYVDLDAFPSGAVSRVIDVCFVSGWERMLASELDNGLWQPTSVDIETYVPKLEHDKARRLLDEWFSLVDVDMTSWLLMVKGKVKPPVDRGAAGKVALPQTIMYNESSGMNAMFSSMLTRFHMLMERLLRPEIRMNSRDSAAEHEVWFNQHEARRASCRSIYRYEGDLFCYDRSQEHVGLTCEAEFYRRMGLSEETLAIWSRTHGVKKATSMMLGVVIWIAQQGLSGIFKTLFRNGFICLTAVVNSCRLTREDIITLDVKGDDFLLEMNRRVDTSVAVAGFALEFNLSTKFYGVDVAYFCSKYWVKVGNYWYWVADPVRRIESLSAAVVCDGKRDVLGEKWVSLREDLRHYDNGLVVEALASAVCERMGLSFMPQGIILGLAALAADKDEFMKFYGPEEKIG